MGETMSNDRRTRSNQCREWLQASTAHSHIDLQDTALGRGSDHAAIYREVTAQLAGVQQQHGPVRRTGRLSPGIGTTGLSATSERHGGSLARCAEPNAADDGFASPAVWNGASVMSAVAV